MLHLPSGFLGLLIGDIPVLLATFVVQQRCSELGSVELRPVDDDGALSDLVQFGRDPPWSSDLVGHINDSCYGTGLLVCYIPSILVDHTNTHLYHAWVDDQ